MHFHRNHEGHGSWLILLPLCPLPRAWHCLFHRIFALQDHVQNSLRRIYIFLFPLFRSDWISVGRMQGEIVWRTWPTVWWPGEIHNHKTKHDFVCSSKRISSCISCFSPLYFRSIFWLLMSRSHRQNVLRLHNPTKLWSTTCILIDIGPIWMHCNDQ